MTDHSETYKGRKIVVRSRPSPSGSESPEATTAAAAVDTELYVDGKQIVVLQTSSGEFIASGFAYAPQASPVELARKLIDHAEQVR